MPAGCATGVLGVVRIQELDAVTAGYAMEFAGVDWMQELNANTVGCAITTTLATIIAGVCIMLWATNHWLA